MATYIPNQASRAIQESSANIMRAMIERAKLQEQRRQFDASFGLEQERVGQAERRIDEQTKARALSMVGTFAPFFAGEPIANSPILASSMGTLFAGEFDPGEWTDPQGLGGMKLGDQSMSQYLNERYQETFESLPEEEQQRILESGVTREITGATSIDQLDVVNLQYKAARDLMENPQTAAQVAETMLGLPQEISVNVRGKSYTWDSEAEARISLSLLGLMMQGEQAGQGAFQQNAKDIAKDLVDLAREQDIGISLGSALTMVNTLHGPLPEGVSRDEAIASMREDFSPEQEAALQMYMRGANLAPAYAQLMQRTAPGALAYAQMYQYLSQDVGMSADMVDELAPNIAKIMSESQFMANPGSWWPGWTNLGQPEGSASDEGGAAGGGGGGGGIDTTGAGAGAGGINFNEGMMVINNAALEYIQGNQTDEDLENTYGEELANVIREQAEYIRSTVGQGGNQ